MDQTQEAPVRGAMPLRVMAALAVHLAIIALPLLAYLLYVNARAPRVEAQYYRALAAVAGELRQRAEHLQYLFAYASPGQPAGAEPWLARARLTTPASGAQEAVECGGTLTRPVRYQLAPDDAMLVARQGACAEWTRWLAWQDTRLPQAPDATVAEFATALSREAQRYAQACRDPDAPADTTLAGADDFADASLVNCARRLPGTADAMPAKVFAARYGRAREVRVPLADLVPLDLARQRFDVVLLADAAGRVLYASQAGWPARLPEPAAAIAAQETAQPALGAWLAPVTRRRSSGYAYPEPFELRLDAVNWTLLCAPVNLAGPTAAQAGHSQLCAAVPSARLQAATRGLAPDVLALVVLLFLLSVCVVPVLKVWLIGPSEAFRPVDLALLFLSVLVSTGLLTLLCCWGGWTLATRARLDASAQDLARQIQLAFERDLGRSGRVLEALAGPQPDGALSALIRPTSKHLTADGGSVVYEAAAAPGFSLLMRLDRHGEQVGAMGLYGLAPLAGPAQVPGRSYFRDALAERHLLPIAGTGQKVSAEQILMRGHGIQATALAAPVVPAAPWQWW